MVSTAAPISSVQSPRAGVVVFCSSIFTVLPAAPSTPSRSASSCPYRSPCIQGAFAAADNSRVPPLDYTLNNPDTLTKYKTAAQISHKVLEAVSGAFGLCSIPLIQSSMLI